MEHSDLTSKYLTGLGVEIGAFKSPIPGIKPIYVDRFAVYANEPTLADYYGDSCSLPFFDSSLDYVASSHVLEHVANPYAALCEWFRVLKHGGIIYMVVPDRRYTFDVTRQLTPVTHMLEDFRKKVTQSDPTHIREFVYEVDWGRFSPSCPPECREQEQATLYAQYKGATDAGNEVNIHFHTFEIETLREMVEQGNRCRVWAGTLEILQLADCFPSSVPNGILVVARVRKSLGRRMSALFGTKGLRPDARRFSQSV